MENLQKQLNELSEKLNQIKEALAFLISGDEEKGGPGSGRKPSGNSPAEQGERAAREESQSDLDKTRRAALPSHLRLLNDEPNSINSDVEVYSVIDNNNPDVEQYVAFNMEGELLTAPVDTIADAFDHAEANSKK